MINFDNDSIDALFKELGWEKSYHFDCVTHEIIGISYVKNEYSISYMYKNDIISLTNFYENPIDIELDEYKIISILIVEKAKKIKNELKEDQV